SHGLAAGGASGGHGLAAGGASGGHGLAAGGASGGHGLAAGGASGGHGLVGLAERARLVNGRLEAGALASGGYRLAVTVPVPRR
ncbi:MAG: hypothetical protein WAL38_06125, partial [Solirubrobacteraceae bacterium]